MKRLIAFCGSKESGKSTSAELFRQYSAIPTKEVAFAGHLKEACSRVFGIEMKYFLDPKLKEVELQDYVTLTKDLILKVFQEFDISEYDHDKHVRPHMGQVFDTPRKVLQYVGTNLLHPIDPLIHINITLKKIDLNVVNLITDLRFPQEFEALYAREDFLPVYVNNKRAENAAAADTHASEQGWKKFRDRCLELDNNGSMNDLMAKIETLARNNA